MSISANSMHKYVTVQAALKVMMHILSNELCRGAGAVYPDVMEARFRSQKGVTLKHTDTIADYRSWHQFTTIDHHEDVEELVFQ